MMHASYKRVATGVPGVSPPPASDADPLELLRSPGKEGRAWGWAAGWGGGAWAFSGNASTVFRQTLLIYVALFLVFLYVVVLATTQPPPAQLEHLSSAVPPANASLAGAHNRQDRAGVRAGEEGGRERENAAGEQGTKSGGREKGEAHPWKATEQGKEDKGGGVKAKKAAAGGGKVAAPAKTAKGAPPTAPAASPPPGKSTRVGPAPAGARDRSKAQTGQGQALPPALGKAAGRSPAPAKPDLGRGRPTRPGAGKGSKTSDAAAGGAHAPRSAADAHAPLAAAPGAQAPGQERGPMRTSAGDSTGKNATAWGAPAVRSSFPALGTEQQQQQPVKPGLNASTPSLPTQQGRTWARPAAAAAAAGAFKAMPALRPIPRHCMDAALLRAQAVHRRNLARRNASFSDPDRPSVGSLSELQGKMLVPTYPCVLEQRVGLGGKGGKWLCRGSHRLQEAGQGELSVVSIGSRGLTSYEEDMHALFGSVPDTFDPFLPEQTLEAVRQLPFMRIHALGLMGLEELPQWKAGPSAAGHPMMALPELLGEIERKAVDVFKVDCEGCEYGLVRDIARLAPSSQVLGQIQMELHDLNRTQRAMELLLGLEGAGYRIFHAEPNAYARALFYEIALVHESLLKPSEGAVGLDSAAEKDAVACYSAFADQAEAVFQANLERKKKPWLDPPHSRQDMPKNLKWLDVVQFVLVPDYPCQLQERFGVWGQGGAWVCLQHRGQCPGGKAAAGQRPLIVTVGGAESKAGSKELNFEEELSIALGAEVHVFNPSLDESSRYPKPPKGKPAQDYADAHVCGAKHAKRHGLKCLGLAGMTAALKQQPVAVLRLDCNGCEFELVEEMTSLYKSNSVPFGQILIRTQEHRLTQPSLQSLMVLGYRLFSVEESDGLFEVSLIHSSCL